MTIEQLVDETKLEDGRVRRAIAFGRARGRVYLVSPRGGYFGILWQPRPA